MLNDRASRPYSYRRTQSLRRFNYEGVNRPTVQPHQLINIPLNEPHKALCTLFVTFNDIDDPEKQITTEHVFNNTNPRQYPQTRKVVYRSNGKKTRMAESPAFIDESDTEKSEHKEVSSKNGSNGSFAKMIVQEVSMTYTGMRGASPPPPKQPTRVDVSRPIRVETNLALPMPSPRSRSNTHGSLREYLSSYDRRVSDAETVDRISQNGRHETEFPVRIAYDRGALSPPVYSVPITAADSRATTHRLGSSLGSLITETTEQHYRAFSTRRSDMAASPTNVNALAQQFERTAREQRAEAQRTAGKRSPSHVVVVKPNPVYKTSSYGSDSERSLDDQNRVRRVERQVYSPTDERSVISTTIVDIEPPNYGRRSVTPQFVQETYQVQEEYHTIKTYTPGRPRSRGDERVHIREVSRETQPVKEIIKEDVQYSRSTSGGPSRAQVSPVKTVVEKFESHLEESTRERRPPMVDQIREEIMVQSRTSQHTREEDERIRRAREEEKRREEERRLLEQRERRMDGRKYETTIIEEQLIEEIRIRRRKDDSDLRNKQEEERLRREHEELERIKKQEEERRREELYIREEQIRIEEERRYREELQIIENRKRIEKEQKEKEEEHQRKQWEEEERREQGRIEADIQRKEKERAERQRQEELRVREELRIQEEIRIEEERRLRILEENKIKAEEEKERSRREDEQRRRDERERQRQAELEEIRRQNEREEEERKRKEEEKREAERKQREEERRKREEEKKKEEERRQKELWERQEERKRKEEEIVLEEERREKERQQRAEERRLQREEQERREEEERRSKAEEKIQLEEARRREAAERRVPESKFEDERRMTEVTIIEETRRIEEDRVRKEREERDELRRKEEEDARKKREEEREREKKREAERRKLEEIRIQEERAKWEEKRRIEEERRAEERRREEERRRQEMEKTKEKKPEPIAPVKETTEISLDSSMTDDYRSTISARPGFTRNVNTFNSNTSTTSYGPVSGNRVLKFVNEVSSSSLSGLSPFGQHAASSIKESREREKKEMSDLNDRLASYIEKVRFLEAQNRKLGTDLDLLRSRWGKDTSSIRTMYESELVEARKLIAETNSQRDLLEKDIYKLREELAEYRRKYETALSSREADRQTIDDLLQKLSALEAELSLLKRRITNIEDEVSRIKKENQRLMGELTRARQDLDQETLNRIDYQNQVQTLLEEIDFIRRVNDQEIRDLQAMASRDTTSENREYFKNELSSAIRDIRQEYDQISTVNKTDMESWYKLKVQEIQTLSARTNMEQGYAKEEVKRLRVQLGDLRGKLADLEGRNSLLEKQIQELNYQLEDDQRSYESALNDRDAQIRKMREECQALMVELQMLLDTKQTLDAEIAIYRKMLEGEENRAGLRQLVEQVVKTTSLTHSEENESLRTLKGETSSRTSFQRSAKGNVSIQETSPDGKYVVLENTHRSREEDIGGWKLKRKIDGKREIVYTLPQNFILRPQKTVKIYARGHGSHGADSLVHEGDDSFGTGSNVQTILFNAAGEERATHIQRSSRE